MRLEEVVSQHTFSSEQAARMLDMALSAAGVVGYETTRGMLELISMGNNPLIGEISAYERMCKSANEHPWTLDNMAELVESVVPLVDTYTFKGMMQRLGFDQETKRRPCLVGNHKHWFLRWQTRRWVVEPSPMVGGHPGGQCEVTMAIVEDMETGQVGEVYPREVRFLDSTPATQPEGDTE